MYYNFIAFMLIFRNLACTGICECECWLPALPSLAGIHNKQSSPSSVIDLFIFASLSM